jgi:Secretion system C-terminal sorting domain
MKKKLLIPLTLLLFAGSSFGQFSDNFDSYTAGNYLCTQSSQWTPFGSLPGGAADVLVVNTDASSAPNSLYFPDTSTSQPAFHYGFITDSIVEVEFNTKVETNKTMAALITGDVNMNFDTISLFMTMANGTITLMNGFNGATEISASHPVNTWFNVRLVGNLVTHTWEFYVNNVSQGLFVSNQITYITDLVFFPMENSGYYLDDFYTEVTEYTANPIDAAAIAVQLVGPTLTGEAVAPKVKIRNIGTDVINGVDVSVSYNGQVLNQSFSGLNLASQQNAELTLTSGSFTCVAGNSQAVVATVTTVNGGVDANLNNNSFSFTPDIVTAAAGKMVFAEEATGTWCGFCPRGTVGMKHMHENFDSYWAGVAVHNGDPMTNTEYDAAMATVVAGYPTGLVDRLPGISPAPSLLENDFKERIQLAPTALLVNGATFDPSSRLLRVSATATFQDAASSNYKMAIVLSENHVTGTTSAYNQTNYFAGGGLGEMGGFELLSDPVPAAQMEYNEVARIIEPDFDGAANCFPAIVNVGEVHTVNASFILPADWDENEIEIISILIDPTGLVDNAGKATVAEAISNGYVNGVYIADNNLSVAENNQIDATFAVYPNPSTANATVVLQLKEGSEVALRLIDMSGKEIVQRNYGYMSGASTIDILTQDLPAGTYTIELVLNNTIMQKKFVKM